AARGARGARAPVGRARDARRPRRRPPPGPRLGRLAVPRYVALLRSVNVGGRSLSMATLREVCERLGHTDVSTYIQIGNLLFTAKRAVAPKSLEAAIAKEFGIDVPVILRTASDVARVIEGDPFPKADRSKVHVGFMATKPTAAAVEKIDHDRFLPEE